MSKLIAAFFAIMIVASPLNAEDRVYAVGQAWEFEAPAPNDNAIIEIRAIEEIGPPENRMEVFHISMSAISLNGMVVPGVSHLPVSRETLDVSVTKLSLNRLDDEDFEEGVQMWREANGGVFDISLADIINVLAQSLLQTEAR